MRMKGTRIGNKIRVGTQILLDDREFIKLKESGVPIKALVTELIILWVDGGVNIPSYRLVRQTRADASCKKRINGKIAREWNSEKLPEPLPNVPVRRKKGRPALNDTEFIRAVVLKELERIFGLGIS